MNLGLHSAPTAPTQAASRGHRSVALYGGYIFETRSTLTLAGLTARFPLKTTFSSPRFEKLHLQPGLEVYHQSTPYGSDVPFVMASLDLVLTTTLLQGLWGGVGLAYLRDVTGGPTSDFGKNLVGLNFLVGSTLVTVSQASLFAQLRLTHPPGLGAYVGIQTGLRFALD